MSVVFILDISMINLDILQAIKLVKRYLISDILFVHSCLSLNAERDLCLTKEQVELTLCNLLCNPALTAGTLDPW